MHYFYFYSFKFLLWWQFVVIGERVRIVCVSGTGFTKIIPILAPEVTNHTSSSLCPLLFNVPYLPMLPLPINDSYCFYVKCHFPYHHPCDQILLLLLLCYLHTAHLFPLHLNLPTSDLVSDIQGFYFFQL